MAGCWRSLNLKLNLHNTILKIVALGSRTVKRAQQVHWLSSHPVSVDHDTKRCLGELNLILAQQLEAGHFENVALLRADSSGQSTDSACAVFATHPYFELHKHQSGCLIAELVLASLLTLLENRRLMICHVHLGVLLDVLHL